MALAVNDTLAPEHTAPDALEVIFTVCALEMNAEKRDNMVKIFFQYTPLFVH